MKEPGGDDTLTPEQADRVEAAQKALEAVIGPLDLFELLTLTVWSLKKGRQCTGSKSTSV